MSNESFFNYVEKYALQLFLALEKVCIIDFNKADDEYEYIDYDDEKEDSDDEKETDNIIKLYCSKCDESINNNIYMITPCGHFFHINCIKKNFNKEVDNDNFNNNTCYYCNQIFL